jgi:hypothetical protein
MPQFQWLTFAAAKQALAQRLADPTNAFWTNPELGLYLAEALRTFNALTEQWNADLAFTPNFVPWYDLSRLPGSPRLRTLTDTDLYTILEYHLLEPPTGGVWTGTSQFNIADLQFALQRRRDEMIQVSGCNIAQMGPLPSVPNTRRTYFPDSTLELRRARFMPDSGLPNTMTREDNLAWDSFEPDHAQTPSVPQSWGVITGPPLAMDVDTGPNVAGQYDVIALMAGIPFNPPANTLLGVPDDWSWLAKWGAMSDLLGRDSEATDRARADYCLKRYQDGLQIMKASNWLLTATINGIPVDTPSVREQDGFSPEWQNDGSAWPSIVTAGMDFLAPCPVGGSPRGVSLVVVGNAPVPVLDADFVQISKDAFDVILDYAQVLASFKMGGEEFSSTKDLEKNFFQFAMETNKRLAAMGLFRDMLGLEGRRQDINQPRKKGE